MILTLHVARRMRERKIAFAWIEESILSPDWTTPDPDPAPTRSYKSIAAFGGRILRVAHRPENGDMLVVTAVFDRGAKRP
jgi:hypothetical protein